VVGGCKVKIERGGQVYDLDMMVVEKGVTLIGAKDSEKMGLVRRIYQVETDM
jgi:hypothetical protein